MYAQLEKGGVWLTTGKGTKSGVCGMLQSKAG